MILKKIFVDQKLTKGKFFFYIFITAQSDSSYKQKFFKNKKNLKKNKLTEKPCHFRNLYIIYVKNFFRTQKDGSGTGLIKFPS